jgi:hypothetical protein
MHLCKSCFLRAENRYQCQFICTNRSHKTKRWPLKVITWVLKPIVSSGIAKVLHAFTDEKLSDRLDKAIAEWASNLPPEQKLVPESLFLKPSGLPDSQEARRDLAQTLKQSRIPSSEQWHSALMERWNEVRSNVRNEDLQQFYKLDELQASGHLSRLASKLQSICDMDPAYFQATMADLWRSIQANMLAEKALSTGDLVITVQEIYQVDYSTNQYLEFAIHNPAGRPLLLTNLSLRVDIEEELPKPRLISPGAPVEEIELTAFLSPGEHEVRFFPKRRYFYEPGSSDFFKGIVSSVGGWKYYVSIEGQQFTLEKNDSKRIVSASFWLTFPRC